MKFFIQDKGLSLLDIISFSILSSSALKTLEANMLIYFLIGYCVIGLIVGIKHLSSGKVGAKGPLVTLLAAIFLWPLFLTMK